MSILSTAGAWSTASSVSSLLAAPRPRSLAGSRLASLACRFGQVLDLVDPADAPCRHAGDQRVSVDAQAARRAALVPVLPLEGAKKICLLEPVPRFDEAQGGVAQVPCALAHLA